MNYVTEKERNVYRRLYEESVDENKIANIINSWKEKGALLVCICTCAISLQDRFVYIPVCSACSPKTTDSVNRHFAGIFFDEVLKLPVNNCESAQEVGFAVGVT